MNRLTTLLFSPYASTSRLISLTVLVTGLLILTVLYFFNPSTSPLYPPCPSRALTGWLCPGCGTLRGLHQLLHGHLAAAWALNPMMVLTLPLILWAAASHFFTVIRDRPLPWPYIRPLLIWLFLAVVMVFTVMRNF